jgi:hypothetical protein
METHSDLSPAALKPTSIVPADLHEAIRCRAEEIYFRSGRIPGRDVENWVQAEKEILRETTGVSLRRHLIAVKFNGVRYIGEYAAVAANGYTPGEFAVGDPVPVRIEGEMMYVKRRNGSELEARIVKKIG